MILYHTIFFLSCQPPESNRQGEETLIVSFSDGDWTSKIIGFAVGLFCCIPFVTAIIGTLRQLSLPKDIENDITVLAAE